MNIDEFNNHSREELMNAALNGGYRKIVGDERRAREEPSRREEHYIERVSWDTEIESVIAEIAVSRWRGFYWMGSHATGGPGTDAGPWQVRWTSAEPGHLILYPESNDEDIFLLVTGYWPKQEIRGWLRAKDGKQEKYWLEPPEVKCASWWIPAEDLNRARSARSSKGATVTDAHHSVVEVGEGGLLLSSPPTVSPSPFEGVEEIL